MIRYNKNVYKLNVFIYGQGCVLLLSKKLKPILKKVNSWKMLLTFLQCFFGIFSPVDAMPAYFIYVSSKTFRFLMLFPCCTQLLLCTPPRYEGGVGAAALGGVTPGAPNRQ